MNDIALIFDYDNIDIEIKDGDLVGDDGLETALLISLYTDKRVSDEELPRGESSKRGWWGDMFPDFDGDQIGSKLWLLDASKQIPSNLPLYEDYVKDALQWLIEDGVASEISCSASYPERSYILIEISVKRPSGENSSFDFLWDGQSFKRG